MRFKALSTSFSYRYPSRRGTGYAPRSAGSILFTVYVYHFGSYNKTYGSLSALLILLTWMWLSAYAVLFGAEINSEAERQTRHMQR